MRRSNILTLFLHCIFFLNFTSSTLFVQVVPLEPNVNKVFAKRNEYLKLNCNVEQEGVTCRWQKDGTEYNFEKSLTSTEEASSKCNVDLTMNHLDVDEHDGNWTCEILNGTTVIEVKQIQVVILSQPLGPVIIVDGKEKKYGSYVPVSSSSSIMCRVIYGNPAANLSWQIDDVDVAGHSEIVEYDSTKEKSVDLYLTEHFDPSWYGKTLKCISRHPAYSTEKRDTYVYLQLNISTVANEFIKEPQDVEVNEGDSVKFECVSAKPFDICLWEKDGQTVMDNWNYKYTINGSYCAISIHKATDYVRDAMWRCSVGNKTAVALSKEAKLTVLVPPTGPFLSLDGTLQSNGSDVKIDIHRPPKITCHSGSGKPAADLQIMLADKPVNATHEISKTGFVLASKQMTVSTLTSTPNPSWFDQTLTCIASHPSYYNQTRTTSIIIQEDDRFEGTLFKKEPHDLLVKEDERNVTLACEAAEPIDSCYWELDGDIFFSTDTFKYNRTSQNCSVVLSRISFYMNDGYYKCVFIKDLVSSESMTAKLSVLVQPNAPVIKLKTRQLKKDSDVVLGAGFVELSCECSFGYPRPSLYWLLDGIPIVGKYETHKYFWSKKETAHLSLASPVNETWYGKNLTCVANHVLFSPNPKMVSVIVRSPILTVKACFVNGMLEWNPRSTDSPTMYCLSHNDPLVRFRWERRANETDSWRPFSDSQNVTVEGISGEYSCVVTNKFEAVRSRSILKIFDSPKSAIVSSNYNASTFISVQPNDTVTLKCTTDSYPPPMFRWEHKLLNIHDEWLNFSFSQRIDFEGVVGQFACVAYNSIGAARSEVITVLIPHDVSVVTAVCDNKTTTDILSDALKNITLSCFADGSPPPTYIWEMRRSPNAPWVFLDDSQNVTLQAKEGQYSCVAWNNVSNVRLRSSEVFTITLQHSDQSSEQTSDSGGHAGIFIAIVILICILLIATSIAVFYFRQRNTTYGLVSFVRGAIGKSTEIPSERIHINDDDDDDDDRGSMFETTSISPLNN